MMPDRLASTTGTPDPRGEESVRSVPSDQSRVAAVGGRGLENEAKSSRMLYNSYGQTAVHPG
jgi:hypothetical protein